MPIQRSQGRLRPLVPRVDELPEGVPAPARVASPDDRGDGGRFAPGNGIASRGGKARAGKTRLASQLSLGRAFADPRFEPYARAAKPFQRAHIATLAKTVGGGVCDEAAASIVASAALQLAASRFAFEVLGDLALGSRLADASRANLMSAAELCARAAQARKQTNPADANRAAWEMFGGKVAK